MKVFMKLLGGVERRWLKGIARLVLLLCALALSSGAWAQTSCTGGGQAYTLTMPASVSIPRDATAGKLLGSWASVSMSSNIWTCTDVGNALSLGALPSIIGADTGQKVTVGGTYPGTYEVFSTSMSGIGIIFNVTAVDGGCGQMPSLAISHSLNGYTCSSGGSYGVAVFAAALVSTGPAVAGIVQGGLVAQEGAYAMANLTLQAAQVNVNTTPTSIVVLSCTTPDVPVPMGTHQVNEFSGIGSTTSPVKSFNISLNNCPAGMNSIQYRIDALTSILNAANSVVALDASSKATGIGVQLLDNTGKAFPLGTMTTFSGYNGGTGGSYTIPFQARYYQTGSKVTAGIANTQMTFTMNYQ
jgi:major type 1 subunit fimbrin (pilin)